MGLLELQDISVRFGGIAALDSVTLSIDSGIVSGLIGPNGAGKTTLFNVITGFQRANSGSVVLAGTDVSKLRPYQRARLGLGRTFQRLELFGSLTVRENVLVAAETRHSSDDNEPMSEMVDDCLKRLGLDHMAGRKAATLPTGSARLVELARAVVADPKMLLLDEPSSGLTSQETQNLAVVLSQLAADGMGVLIVEHDMDLIMKACSTIHVLDFGGCSNREARVRCRTIRRCDGLTSVRRRVNRTRQCVPRRGAMGNPIGESIRPMRARLKRSLTCGSARSELATA